MDKIIQLINTMPYGQVAPLAMELGRLIKEQTDNQKEGRIIQPVPRKGA
jgi:hypothetical protein